MTLPLIYTLNNCDAVVKQQLLLIINKQNNNEEKLQYLKEQVRAAGGFNYAEGKMIWYRNEALNRLYEFPDSGIRQALEELVFYITERKY
jgi:octaprenyl-diphosphate synthase